MPGRLRDLPATRAPVSALRHPRGDVTAAPGPDRSRLVLVERIMLTAPADPYLSLQALSDYSGLSPRTLRKFLERNPPAQALPCYRLEGKVLVRRSDFD